MMPMPTCSTRANKILALSLLAVATYFNSEWAFSQQSREIVGRQLEAADSLFADGAYEEALTLLENINSKKEIPIELKTRSLRLTGNCLNRQKQIGAALEKFTQAIALVDKQIAMENSGERRSGTSIADLKYQKADLLYVVGALKNALGDFDGAKESYTLSIETDQNYVASHNNLSWLYATCSDDSIHDPELAIYHATMACALTDFDNPASLDTLSAAFARAGRFQAAVSWQNKAFGHPKFLETVPRTSIKEYSQRLKLYQSKQPYVETEKQN